MIFRLRDIFGPKTLPDLPEPTPALALGALLVRVARSDDDYQVEEISLIDRILARLHDLGPIEAARMRATCERLEASAPGSDRFAALIRDALPVEDRRAALIALWQIVLADGEQQPPEVQIVESARVALGLSVADSETARAAAAA